MAESPDIRIGTAERTDALDLLGEHFGLGRLNLAEFEERSARASVATTRSELDVLFTDLPAITTHAPATVDESSAHAVATRDDRWRRTVMGLTPLVALVLFFVFDTWLFFLLVPAMGILLFAGRDDADPKDKKKNH